MEISLPSGEGANEPTRGIQYLVTPILRRSVYLVKIKVNFEMTPQLMNNICQVAVGFLNFNHTMLNCIESCTIQRRSSSF